MVSVELNPAALPVAGLKLGVAPAGRPDTDRAIGGRPTLEDPLTSDSVMA